MSSLAKEPYFIKVFEDGGSRKPLKKTWVATCEPTKYLARITTFS